MIVGVERLPLWHIQVTLEMDDHDVASRLIRQPHWSVLHKDERCQTVNKLSALNVPLLVTVQCAAS